MKNRKIFILLSSILIFSLGIAFIFPFLAKAQMFKSIYGDDEDIQFKFLERVIIGDTTISEENVLLKVDGHIDVNHNAILNVGAPNNDTDAANRGYVDSVVGTQVGAADESKWTLSGNNIFSKNTGNVGIGTDSPGAKLDVSGTAMLGGGDYQFVVERIGSSPSGEDLPHYLLISRLTGSVGIRKLSGTIFGARRSGHSHAGMIDILVSDTSTVENISASFISRQLEEDLTVSLVTLTYDGNTWLALRMDTHIHRIWNTTGWYFSGHKGSGIEFNLLGDSSVANVTPFSSFHNSSFNIDDSLVINTSGNVGIGNTSPNYKLDVTGTSRFADPLFVGTPIAGGHAVTKEYVDGIEYVDESKWNESGNNIYNKNTGNVGIGTTEPDAKLHIRQTGAPGADGLRIIKDSDSGYSALTVKHNTGVATRTVAEFKNNDGTVMMVRGDGNVGIGTASPGVKLDVSGGDIRTNQQLVSTVVTGTAPLIISSTTRVNNLNVQYLDGESKSYYDHRRYTDATNYLGGYYASGGSAKPNDPIFGAGKFKLAMLSGSNLGFGGSWNDVLWFSGYTGGDVKNSYAIVGDKYSDNLYFSRQPYDSTSWGTGRRIWHSGHFTSTNVSNWDTAYVERGSQIAGTNLSWSGGNLNVTGVITAESDPTWSGSANTTGNIGRTGNVGIGTASPGAKLDIHHDTNILRLNTSDSPSWYFDMGGSQTAGTYRMYTWGSSRTLSLESMGDVAVVIDYNNNQTNKAFRVMHDGEGVSGNELFRVQENGNVGIGTHSPSYELEVNGDVKADSFIYDSDINLKKDIVSISDGLDKLRQLNPVYFNWKKNDKPSLGFIAQEVEKVLPELVSNSSGSMGVHYGNITAVLTASLQEQQRMIERQQRMINDLNRRLTELE